MIYKKHLAETTKGLIQEFNEFLKVKKISNNEMPFIVKKVQFVLDDNINENFSLVPTKKCVKWDSKVVERTDPTSGKKYWHLVEWCVEYKNEQ